MIDSSRSTSRNTHAISIPEKLVEALLIPEPGTYLTTSIHHVRIPVPLDVPLDYLFEAGCEITALKRFLFLHAIRHPRRRQAFQRIANDQLSVRNSGGEAEFRGASPL